jgi:hypothetical protein
VERPADRLETREGSKRAGVQAMSSTGRHGVSVEPADELERPARGGPRHERERVPAQLDVILEY